MPILTPLVRSTVATCALLATPLATLHSQSSGVRMDTLFIQVVGIVGRVDTLKVGDKTGGNREYSYVLVHPRGTRLAYDLRTIKGFGDPLAVWGDTLVSMPRGIGTLDGNTLLRAEAERPIRIQPENRKLFQLQRELLKSKDPLAAYVELSCEIGRVMDVYPDTMANRLIKEASYLAVDPERDAAALMRVNRALGGHSFSSDCEENRQALKRRPAVPFP